MHAISSTNGWGMREEITARRYHGSASRLPMLFLWALIAFLVLPGIVAFLAPALLVGSIETSTPHGEGIAVFVAGALVLLWCVRDFYVAGKGTLAPWDPPTSRQDWPVSLLTKPDVRRRAADPDR